MNDSCPASDGAECCHETLKHMQFKTFELMFSGVFHLIFSNHKLTIGSCHLRGQNHSSGSCKEAA